MIFKNLSIALLLVLLTATITYGQPKEVKIVGKDQMRYSIEKIEAKAGEKFKITLTTKSAMDKSQMAHNWVLLKQGTDALNFVTKGLKHPNNEYIDPSLKDRIIAKTKMLGNGETDSIVFTVPEKKGKYQYVCTFRAHFQAGMKGVLIVN